MLTFPTPPLSVRLRRRGANVWTRASGLTRRDEEAPPAAGSFLLSLFFRLYHIYRDHCFSVLRIPSRHRWERLLSSRPIHQER